MRRTFDGVARSVVISAVTIAFVACDSTTRADLPPLSPRAMGNGASITRAAGYEFVTVGNPGNAPVPAQLQDDTGGVVRPDLGVVNYSFAISRTEVTYSDYLPFVRAYASHFGDDPTFALVGRGIAVLAGNNRDPNNYILKSGYENSPVEVGWRYAARFCNWLSNDRRTDVSAFTSGSYDATTFGPPDTSLPPQDNYNRQPGARFFLPTLNEWTKAMYYDPSRYAPGQGGYWTYPISSDSQPAFGLPSTGGESSYALVRRGILVPLAPASYPGIMSPWGLFDGSGGAAEWLEDGADRRFRYTRGSAQFDFGSDLIGWDPQSNAQDLSFPMGIRLGMTVPSSSTGLAVLLGTFVLSRRSR